MTPPGHCRLILTRHAKSDWDDPSLPDQERPLNARGRRSARALGDWLASRGYDPEEVLCSSALRTRQTWDCVAQAVFETRPDLRIEPALYQAAPETMLRVLKTATASTVMMIGHNPGIAWFARDLMLAQPDHPRFEDYPTGATLVARFDIDDWNTLQPGTGRFEAFVTPRDLIE